MKRHATVIAAALMTAGLLSVPAHLSQASTRGSQEGSATDDCRPGHQNPACTLDPIDALPPKPEPEPGVDHAQLFFLRDMAFLLEQLELEFQLSLSQWWSPGRDTPSDSAYKERQAQREAKQVEAMKKGAAEALRDSAIIKRIVDAVPTNSKDAVRNYLKNIMKHDFVRLCDTYSEEIRGDTNHLTEAFLDKNEAKIYDYVRKAFLPEGIQTQLKINVVILETREGSVFALPGVNNSISDFNLLFAWSDRVQLKQGNGENSCGT